MQDGFILWSWELVFIPMWIIFGVALIVVVYTALLAAVLVSWSSNMTNDQRRASSHGALGFAALVIPSLASLVIRSCLKFSTTHFKNLFFSFA